jgi:2-haloacid dehalogenase
LNPHAIIFDAYGTLFDVHSVIRNGGVGIPGNLEALSQLWRRKQLEYTWLRALMDRYEDFWHITEDALRSAVRELSIGMTDGQLANLMQSYLVPTAFPEVGSALEAVKRLPLAVLSNGSPAMLDAAVRYNSVESYFAEIISVDRVKTYKPSPRVYALGSETLDLPAAEFLFVSSNLQFANNGPAAQ